MLAQQATKIYESLIGNAHLPLDASIRKHGAPEEVLLVGDFDLPCIPINKPVGEMMTARLKLLEARLAVQLAKESTRLGVVNATVDINAAIGFLLYWRLSSVDGNERYAEDGLTSGKLWGTYISLTGPKTKRTDDFSWSI